VAELYHVLIFIAANALKRAILIKILSTRYFLCQKFGVPAGTLQLLVPSTFLTHDAAVGVFCHDAMTSSSWSEAWSTPCSWHEAYVRCWSSCRVRAARSRWRHSCLLTPTPSADVVQDWPTVTFVDRPVCRPAALLPA